MSETKNGSGAGTDGARVRVVLSWLLVGVPLAYGIFQTLSKASALFG